MKTHIVEPRTALISCAVGLGLVVAQVDAQTDPRITSWYTAGSGKYARVFTTTAAQNANTPVTTWSRNSINQSSPAYTGVQEIYSSANWIYLRTTGLGSHVMGPWYLNAAKTQLFPNLPANKKAFYRIPRSTTVPGTKTLTGLGVIGYFVDGVAMFDSRDGYYWNAGTGAEAQGPAGSFWNRDAYVNEGITFDPANAHQEQSGTYHYHANPIALRSLLGDNVLFNIATKTYSENTTNAAVAHSPILGWVRDGIPIYGPYGYSNATNANSGVRRMISGFVLRNGDNGTDNLTNTARAWIPQWAVRVYNVSSNQSGPAISATYPLGRYLEDNAYLGDLGRIQGVDFDLDEFNGRFCVTPEYPNGIYAYFISIKANGAPAMPYNIGRRYYGSPTGAAVTTLAEQVTTNFVGGAESALKMSAPVAPPQNSTVTLVWSSVEGGTYRVDSTTDLAGWTQKATNIISQGITTQLSTNRNGTVEMYRVARTAIATYDPVK